jgi:hypothetical protein
MLEETVPDTMTSFIISAVGSSSTGNGLAVSDPQAISVYQDFFLQMSLPYVCTSGV